MMRPHPYLLLLGKLAPYWRLVVPALCAMLISAAMLAVLPLFIQRLLDNIFIQQDLALVQSTLLSMLMLFTVRGIADAVNSHAAAKTSSRLAADLRMDIFHKLLALPVNYYRQLQENNEIDSVLSQVHHITQDTLRYIATGIHDLLVIIGLILAIFFLNQEFFVLLVFATPLIGLIFQMTRSHLSKSAQRNLTAAGNLSQYVRQSLKHSREIRLNGGQTQESKRLGEIAHSLYQEEMRRSFLAAIIKPSGEWITALIIVAVVYFITQQTFNRSLTFADVGAIIAAVLLLIDPLRRSARLLNKLTQDQQNCGLLWLFLERASEEDSGTQYLKHIHGKLEFRQLRLHAHTDDAKPILGPINLTIKAGETIVFTGYTDEEKNALIDLILRMRQPSSGALLLDDHSLSDIVLGCLHSNIGIVMKDGRLLSDKIVGNIAYGKMRCAHEFPITAAAQASRAAAFIREMPEGLQTSVSKSRLQLTPSQCHFLAIARNFLKNPPILILDEVPAIDTADSGHLLSALDELACHRTTLVFNRHIPQLKKIDRIVVLENGCITENLTHISSAHRKTN